MIRFDLPDHIETRLRMAMPDLERAAKEAALVDLYRQGLLSHSDLAEGLGLSRHEADGVLKRHGVTAGAITADELAEQVEMLDRALGPGE